MVFILATVLMVSGKLFSQSCIAILLNEYQTTNLTGQTDYFGVHSDWVELHNAHTSSVSLSGYFLSNDRNNLKKWKFPSNFTLGLDEYKIVWLTGKNTTINGEYHANFTLEQCKNQWLILSTTDGVVRDSVYVQPTKGDHTRGRIDCASKGILSWRLYTTPSFKAPNPLVNYYIDYSPLPKFIITSSSFTTNPTEYPQKGNWFEGSQVGFFMENGIKYDTATSCYDLFYTKNGDYPVPFYPGNNQGNYYRYYDSTSSFVTLDQTTVLRFIMVPRPGKVECQQGYLPSFCETTTYFISPGHSTIGKDFGVVSLAINYLDTNWFNTSSPVQGTTVHVEYYDNKKQVSEGYGNLWRPVNEEWRNPQRGAQISIDDRNGFGCNFNGPIFNVDSLGTSTRSVFPMLHLKGGDIESHSTPNGYTQGVSEGTGIRDVLIQSLAARYDLNVNPLHIKPVITFVNGKYKGVYSLMEVYDKYYEQFYNRQSADSADLRYYHYSDGTFTYSDGSQTPANLNNFKRDVYDYIMNNPMNIDSRYNTAMSRLDKASFIDYMILNSFFMNGDMWNYNIAYAKGSMADRPGSKWHYYLWNTPSTLSFTFVTNPKGLGISNALISPCYLHTPPFATVSPLGLAGNGHGNMLALLMGTYTGKQTWGNANFQREYKNRYMDLLNGPLKCENLSKQYSYIYRLYRDEMLCHEDACTDKNGAFTTAKDLWDTNMVRLKTILDSRCYAVATAFGKTGCYGLSGPFNIGVTVEPEGAGKVRLNTTELPFYRWEGKYYLTTLSFKAIPSDPKYVFDHWEFKAHTPILPASMDSTAIVFAMNDEVTAVFTDKSTGISTSGDGMNIPTGFTPNGDGLNDYFRVLGAGKHMSEFDMRVFNRWGEEVYRSTDPTAMGWDGNYKGQSAVTGVYAFVITYKNIYGELKMAKGNVTLTR